MLMTFHDADSFVRFTSFGERFINDYSNLTSQPSHRWLANRSSAVGVGIACSNADATAGNLRRAKVGVLCRYG